MTPRETDTELAAVRQEIAALDEAMRRHRAMLDETLPPACLSYAPSVFTPGVLAFKAGKFHNLISDVSGAWPHIAGQLRVMLDLQPQRHQLEEWQARIERGATLGVWLVDDELRTEGVGIIEPEVTEDGKRIVFAGISMSRGDPVDLTELAKNCEALAVVMGADEVMIWTTIPTPVLPGYQLLNAYFGQIMVTPVQPIQ